MSEHFTTNSKDYVQKPNHVWVNIFNPASGLRCFVRNVSDNIWKFVEYCKTPHGKTMVVVCGLFTAIMFLILFPWSSFTGMDTYKTLYSHYVTHSHFYKSKHTYEGRSLVDSELSTACRERHIPFIVAVSSNRQPEDWGGNSLQTLVHDLLNETKSFRTGGMCTRVVVFNVDDTVGTNDAFYTAMQRDSQGDPEERISFVSDREGKWNPDELDSDLVRGDPALYSRKRVRDIVWILRALSCFNSVNTFAYVQDNVFVCPGSFPRMLQVKKKASLVNNEWKLVRLAPGVQAFMVHRRGMEDLANFLEDNIHTYDLESSLSAWIERNLDTYFVTKTPLFHKSPRGCVEVMGKENLSEKESFDESLCPVDDLYPCAPGQRFSRYVEWFSNLRDRMAEGLRMNGNGS